MYERTNDTKTKVSGNAYSLTYQKSRSYNLQKPFWVFNYFLPENNALEGTQNESAACWVDL